MGLVRPDQWTGSLAESWEMPSPDTYVFHIRKGVHWWNKPPVNGRELDANDVVFSLKRLYTLSTSYTLNMAPDGKKPESITATDNWTVVIKCPAGYGAALCEHFGDMSRIIPHEVIEKYGDMRDWHNVCGTGPFMVTDDKPDSITTLVKNPNYWGKDPVFPNNALPYLDGVNILTIQDISTRVAGMRTGKIDYCKRYEWQDAQSLIKTNPELKYVKYADTLPYQIYMKSDKKPYSDIKVRQALAMGIDRPKIVKDFYQGNAELLAFPVLNVTDFADVYIPLEKLSPTVQDIYGYHPDKAKQLLTDAGYPTGFKTSIICSQPQVDVLSIVKDNLAKIGVDMDIQVKEYSVWRSIASARTHTDMIIREQNNAMPWKMLHLRLGTVQNMSFVDDKRCQDTYKVLCDTYYDQSKRAAAMRDILPYIYEQSWVIQLPDPVIYGMWQPWVRGFHGESGVGHNNENNFAQWIWVDRNAK